MNWLSAHRGAWHRSSCLEPVPCAPHQAAATSPDLTVLFPWLSLLSQASVQFAVKESGHKPRVTKLTSRITLPIPLLVCPVEHELLHASHAWLPVYKHEAGIHRRLWCSPKYNILIPWGLVVVVQSPSCVQLFETPWAAARQASLSPSNPQSLPEFMSIELVMPSNSLVFCHPLLPLPSILPSIRVFSSESALCTRWPKYWSFSFSISPSNKYSGLISLRIDWFEHLEGWIYSLMSLSRLDSA